MSDHEYASQGLARLREIAELGLAAEIEDERLQAIVDQAAAELDLPIAAISILLDSAQYFIASHGLEGGWIGNAGGTPHEWSFCRNAVDRREPFIVENAAEHPLVRDNPLVRVDGIRSYLGVPLITSKDEAIGALCVIGKQARRFSFDEIGRLRAFARELLPVLEARRAS